MADYELICKQLEGFVQADPYFIPVMANASALLWEELDEINWAGFYLVRDGQLVLGPFQGKTACIHIQKGKGVCGTAWAEDNTLVVADVHSFKGHIACDAASRSEIVVPIHKGNEVVAVLDIDSPVTDRFSENDKSGLVKFARILEEKIIW